MNQFTMCNLIEEISNQVDLDNDNRWMERRDGISALPVMLDVTHGNWAMMVKAKAGSKMPTHYHTKPLYVFTVYGHWHFRVYQNQVERNET